MRLNKYLNNVKCVVINLKERSDKRTYMKKHLKSQGFDYDFFDATKHSNPKRGCLESHLSVIKKTLDENNKVDEKNKTKYLLILEDDCKFIDSVKTMKEPPPSWDMLYLGGTVHRVMDKEYNGYARVQCWTTHAYIINLTNVDLINKIMEASSYEGEIDRYYLEKIHPNFKAYMTDPMIAIQKEGFSDIENQEVSYDFMQYTLKGLRTPEHMVDNNGNYILKLPKIKDEDLPCVSIITPTFKRRKMFSMAIRNFEEFIYPKNKLEWIIIDDSPETETTDETVKDLLPRDKRIKFIQLPFDHENNEPMTVATKRNIGVSNSSYDYIVHMDDDDYYPPESILARIKILLKYKNNDIECVGSTLIGTYNILNNTSSMSSDGPISLSEASMAYTKKFWEQRPFDETCQRGEHKSFCEQRLDKIMDIPYSFILIAINHKNNLTEHLRTENSGLLKFSDKTDKEGEIANFFDTWDIDTQYFIMELKKYLLK